MVIYGNTRDVTRERRGRHSSIAAAFTCPNGEREHTPSPKTFLTPVSATMYRSFARIHWVEITWISDSSQKTEMARTRRRSECPPRG